MADGGTAAVIPEMEQLQADNIPEHAKMPVPTSQQTEIAPSDLSASQAETSPSLAPINTGMSGVGPDMLTPMPDTKAIFIKNLKNKLETALEKNTDEDELDEVTEELVEE